jgi:phage gp29-like protein
MSTKPKKTTSEFNSATVQRALMQRANLLPNITPELVTSWHSSFRRGYLRSAAIAWELIMNSDDMIVSAAPKREKAVSRHGFEIITIDNSDKAKAHAKTLEEFYNNLTATNAVDLNERGGFKMLVRQMMKSVGMKYAVHEIVWRPGPVFSAEFRYVPLWFFENISGKLRFLPTAYGTEGQDMPDGEWMVTTGDGIMAACTACYLFKHLPLQDWLIFSERFGMNTVWGECADTFESDGWNAMVNALSDLAGGNEVLVSAGSKINSIEWKNAGALPYKELVERMDRALVTMWRGGDLSTISSNAVGAEMQDEEKDTLENDDAANITDVLNEQVDKHVIRYVHGDATPLAWVKIKENVKQDTKIDLEIDKGLREAGYEEPLEEVQKRYGRPHLRKKTEVGGQGSEVGEQKPDVAAENESATAQMKRIQESRWWDRSFWQGVKNLIPGANTKQSKAEKVQETLLHNARAALATAVDADLIEIYDRLAEIINNTPDNELVAALEEFQTLELPKLAAASLADPAAADVIADTLSAGLLNSMAATAEHRPEDGGQK